ncbi:MAG TPA: hypothetical protein PKY56_02515 [Candidatus Kapabacteria bacterium]|nr:hypothetical protein [Candidatus Kapabacteria bacterium]HPO62537.1 hypothetical protein [Candidatus Kapabacteria bacterium]
MKVLKYLVSIAFLICLFACSEDSVTKFSNYNKTTIQSDSNWVEVTEIDTVFDLCYHGSDVLGGAVCRNIDDYRYYYNLVQNRIKEQKAKMSQELRNQLGPCYKFDTLVPPAINFNNKDLILYGIKGLKGSAEFIRKIYFNKQTKEYLYLLKIFLDPRNFVLSIYDEAIALPELDNINKIRFDTIMVYTN